MEIIYRIVYLENVLHHVKELPPSVKNLIKTAIEERLMSDPIKFGKPLRYSLKGHRRLKVSDYRIIYRVDSLNKTVLIIAIQHRKDIYQNHQSI